MNVALYAARGKRWAMTERRTSSLARESARLAIGPSSLTWDGASLTALIDEVATPIPRRIQGTIRLFPAYLAERPVVLSIAGAHTWRAIAPVARIEVNLRRPNLTWQGSAYFDSNFGDSPLEHSFAQWDWSRASLRDGGTAVLYDVIKRDRTALALALRFSSNGSVTTFEAPPVATLGATGWGIRRSTRSEPACPARVLRVLEDTPFYARSVIEARLLGEPINAVHESLSLDRFQSRWVQTLLPFKMPRTRR